MKTKTEAWRNIATLENQFEAEILEQVLKDQQIPALFRSYEDLAYGSLYQSQKGWGSIWAPPEYEAEILAFLEEIRAQAANAQGLAEE